MTIMDEKRKNRVKRGRSSSSRGIGHVSRSISNGGTRD